MFNVLGNQYSQVMVMTRDGLIDQCGGATTNIMDCLGTAEIRSALLDNASEKAEGDGEEFHDGGEFNAVVARTRCPNGCHELLVAKEINSEIFSIYLR